MKKMVLMLMMSVAMFVAIPAEECFAADVCVGYDNYGGWDIYVVSESIDTNGVSYVNVTVKKTKNGNQVEISHERYGRTDDGTWYVNSEEGIAEGVRATRTDPNEDAVLRYCLTQG